MPFLRSLAAGALVAGALSGYAIAGVGAAAAASVAPVAGGWEIDLDHSETVWVDRNHIGAFVGDMPNPAAGSFGRSLDSLTDLAARYPQGRVSFTIFGPLANLSGTMTALAN